MAAFPQMLAEAADVRGEAGMRVRLAWLVAACLMLFGCTSASTTSSLPTALTKGCSRALAAADAAVSQTEQAMKSLAAGVRPDIKTLSSLPRQLGAISVLCSIEAASVPEEATCYSAARDEADFIGFAVKVMKVRMNPSVSVETATQEARAWLSTAKVHEQNAVAERANCPVEPHS
jgi:hypothetical protein